jgi:hypothetical protein
VEEEGGMVGVLRRFGGSGKDPTCIRELRGGLGKGGGVRIAVSGTARRCGGGARREGEGISGWQRVRRSHCRVFNGVGELELSRACVVGG